MHVAKCAKKDEFYTQRGDIEDELKHYAAHFKDKRVYCNCDDPRASEFYKFFKAKFASWKLKSLTASCYKSSDPDLFTQNDSEQAVWIEFDGETETLQRFAGNGDFRSDESIKMLDQSDIVCTNPPFSLFREYVAQLMEHGKKFLVIGSMNAVTYKEIFPLFRDDRVWYWPSIKSGDRIFGIPEHYPLNAANAWIDDAGNKFIRVKGVRWFTNMSHKRRNEELNLYKRYARTPEDFPTYDNYDAIEVSKVANIPEDYAGAMGVPITFLDKYCPEQFEILGSDYDVKEGRLPRLVKVEDHKLDRGYVNGKRLYSRIFIRNRKPKPATRKAV